MENNGEGKEITLGKKGKFFFKKEENIFVKK